MEMSGSDEGYQKTLESLQGARNCILNRIDVLELQLDASSMFQSEGSRKTFFDKYCPKFNESVSCLDDVFEGLAKCTGQEDEETVPVFRDMAYGVVELVCQNNGQFLMDAQKPEFKACLERIKESAEECKLSNVTRSISMSQYGEEQCREVKNSRECIKAKADTCDAPEVFNIFDVFYNRVMKHSSCDRDTKVVVLYDNNIDGASNTD